MIGRLTGVLVAKQPPMLLLDVQGIGYEIEVPMSTFFKLPASGETITLQTHFVVREDAQLLFGFATQTEKSLFREIIRISGIGPKLGLAILSGIGVEDFWAAVRAGETGRLVKLPGIGKKTAERIVIELRDKAGAGGPGDIGMLTSAGVTIAASPPAEARAALESLGYKPVEAQKLIDAIAKDGMSTDQLIREALRRAVR
ncbi:MAG: Holliday junction branch migration protein RuvA [Nevskia sp.]